MAEIQDLNSRETVVLGYLKVKIDGTDTER